MKLVYPALESHIEINDNYVNGIVVENPDCYYEMIRELKFQESGEEGRWVLSSQDSPIPINKNIELIVDFIDFDVNKKVLLTKMLGAFEKVAFDEEHLDESHRLLSEIERFIIKLSEGYDIELQCDKITVQQLLKSVGISIILESEKLTELLYSYMQLVREFIADKLFVFVNLRSFVSQRELQLFVDTVIRHGYKMLLFDSRDYPVLKGEKRIIVDEDLCEI